MDEEAKREAAQFIGILIVLTLALAIWLSLAGSIGIVAGLGLWLGWSVGGAFGAMTAQTFIPIYKGCQCKHCQAKAGSVVAAFVFWPVAVPGLIAAAIAAALIRGALS
jgi:hypothetical protein